MNMEGTKHEKAILVLLAYIIGFTSAFIAFGIAKSISVDADDTVAYEIVSDSMGDTDDMMVPETDVQPTAEAPLPSAPEEGAADSSVLLTGKGTEVYYENGKLYASTNGDMHLLSVAKNKLTSAVAEAFSSQGSHIAIPKFSVSTDGSFVYFCEQQQETDSCVNFVYDVTGDVIQYVSAEGKKVVTSAAIAETANWTPAGLTFGTYRSQSTEKPWIVTVQ